ncbi:MAG: TolC family protein [Bacteroidales bacterium]|nr:TolC family protein [Bacteroidales bacterium]
MKRLKNNVRGISLAALLCLSLSGSTLSAQSMSLQNCIDYAIGHNVSIQQQELSRQNQEITLNSSKMNRLPDVNASVGQGWGFGRSTGRDGSTVDQTSSQTSFSIGASVPLFTGFRIPNQIKSNRYSLEAASATLEKARRDIGIQVATYYLNALYYKGMTLVQQRQLELDSVNCENAKALFEAGKRPESEVAAAEAQLAMSRHNLTEAQGNEILARLDLMQMLNLEGNVEQFSIQDIDTKKMGAEIEPADQVFHAALENHPSIMAAKYNLESSKYQLKATKSGYMPTLSFNASYSNSYYHLYNSQNMSLHKQLDLNGSEYLGLSLNIPIFDRFSTRNNVRQAKLNIESQHLALTEAQQNLRKEIQQAYWNAVKARENYASAQKAHQSTSLAYQYEAERYASGKGTNYDLQQASTNRQKAQHDELQAKYEFLMRLRILQFYNGQ